jgi:hypothetical protein
MPTTNRREKKRGWNSKFGEPINAFVVPKGIRRTFSAIPPPERRRKILYLP